MIQINKGIKNSSRFLKRCFDIFFSLFGLILFSIVILLAIMIASIETNSNGVFKQTRIGMNGKPFKVLKIKTMKNVAGTTVTTSNDSRITKSGKFFRKTKIDELPQLWNVLKGDMSFVGPRPDVPGYADRLVGDDRIVLSIRPGITGPASIKYKNEEEILANVKNPERYNAEVIYPDKVRINKLYIQEYSLLKDIKYIINTII